MTREDHLMVQAMEECDEISQRISKAMRFGLHQVQPGQPLSNHERIRLEFVDLVAMIRMFDFNLTLFTEEEVALKQAKVERYLKFAAECGRLD